MWFNTNTQAVYRSHAEIRAAFVNTSFPSELHDAVLLDFGVCALLPSPIPEHDPAVQIAEEGQPLQIDGLWTQQWTVRALTPEELQARVPKLEAARSLMAVTPRQARLALHQSGLLNAVEDYVADSTDLALKIEWAFATEIRRTWPPVAAFAQANEISDADVDELFTLAATL